MGAGKWLLSNTGCCGPDVVDNAPRTPKSQRMAKLREESRPLVDAAKELRSLVPEMHISESARGKLQQALQ